MPSAVRPGADTVLAHLVHTAPDGCESPRYVTGSTQAIMSGLLPQRRGRSSDGLTPGISSTDTNNISWLVEQLRDRCQTHLSAPLVADYEIPQLSLATPQLYVSNSRLGADPNRESMFGGVRPLDTAAPAVGQPPPDRFLHASPGWPRDR